MRATTLCRTIALACAFSTLLTAAASAQTKAPARSPVRQAQATEPRPSTTAPTATAPSATAPGPRTAAAPPARQQLAPAQTERVAAGQPNKPGAKAPPGPRTAATQPLQLAQQAPFELTKTQQELLEKILLKWEKQSDKVKTYSCTFTRWEYDPTWGPKENHYEKSRGGGFIKFRAPDQGEYCIDSLEEFDANQKKYVKKDAKTDVLDHWLCDGKSIFEYNTTKKQLIERRLPPDMQGKAIADGPLPFIFGAKAEQLKRRYWLRDITPTDQVGQRIWLEAYPKFQADAANFQRATIILTENDFLPYGLEIILPGAERPSAKGEKRPVASTAYTFGSNSVNSPLAAFAALRPKLSLTQQAMGWKQVLDDGANAAAEAKPKAPPAAEAPQAKRPATAPRK